MIALLSGSSRMSPIGERSRSQRPVARLPRLGLGVAGGRDDRRPVRRSAGRSRTGTSGSRCRSGTSSLLATTAAIDDGSSKGSLPSGSSSPNSTFTNASSLEPKLTISDATSSTNGADDRRPVEVDVDDRRNGRGDRHGCARALRRGSRAIRRGRSSPARPGCRATPTGRRCAGPRRRPPPGWRRRCAHRRRTACRCPRRRPRGRCSGAAGRHRRRS